MKIATREEVDARNSLSFARHLSISLEAIFIVVPV